MANWRVWLQADGNLGVTYVNPVTGATFKCGVVRADTPVQLVLQWVLDRGQAATLDVITLPAGEALVVLPELVDDAGCVSA